MTLKKQFGQRLRFIRRLRDITQQQLAESAELSVDFVSLVERGLNAPSFESIERLAQALEVPVSYFFAERNTDMSRGSSLTRQLLELYQETESR